MTEVVVIVDSPIFWVAWVGCILIATYLGTQKSIPLLGFVNGLVLGPIGVLIVMIQDNKNRISCPSCAESVMKEAKICPHCRQTINI